MVENGRGVGLAHFGEEGEDLGSEALCSTHQASPRTTRRRSERMLVDIGRADGAAPGPANGCHPICLARSGKRPVAWARVVRLFFAHTGVVRPGAEATMSANRGLVGRFGCSMVSIHWRWYMKRRKRGQVEENLDARSSPSFFSFHFQLK